LIYVITSQECGEGRRINANLRVYVFRHTFA